MQNRSVILYVSLATLGVYALLGLIYSFLPAAWTQPIRGAGELAFAPFHWMGAAPSDGERSKDEGFAMEVRALRVTPSEIVPQISSAGEIEYLEKFDIVSKSPGRIEKLFVEEGERVKAGQLLAQIERLPLELQLSRQRANLEAAASQFELAKERYRDARLETEIEYQRIEQQITETKQLRAQLDRTRETFRGREILFNEGAISREEFLQSRQELINREAEYLVARKDLDIARVGFRDQDIRERGLEVPEDPDERTALLIDINTRTQKAERDAAEAQMKAAAAELRSTQVLLNETEIVSPADGMVARRNKSVGEEVAGGSAADSAQAIMVIVKIDRVYAVVNVKETESQAVKTGQTMKFQADVFPDREFTGSVRLISPLVDPKTHTVAVKAMASNPGYTLRPGMFIRGAILTGAPRKAILIPESALQPLEDNRARVFVIREGRVYRTEVQTGKQQEDRVEIESGLEAGDLIAVEKFSLLREGLKVTAILESPQEEAEATGTEEGQAVAP